MSKADKMFEEWAMCASTMQMVDFEEYESRLKELVDKATPKQVLDEHIYIEGKGVCKVVDDVVHSPNHYIGEYGLEVEEVLRNFLPRYVDSYVAHRIGSAIEYLLRSPLKNGKQDLEKAKYNLEQALECYD